MNRIKGLESVAQIVAQAGGVEEFLDKQEHLRDRFAMVALMTILAQDGFPVADSVGRHAYRVADLMMKARMVPPVPEVQQR